METIVVIRRDDAFAGAWPQGFLPVGTPGVAEALETIAKRGFAAERAIAEATPAWKQPIPYCALVRGEEVYCVERLPQQGERRLHGRLSIGLGGHVDAGDVIQPCGALLAALERELSEEVELVVPAPTPPTWPQPRFLGLLNDDSSEVGRVHFGLVFGVLLPETADVQILERSKMRGAFRHLAGQAGLWQDLERFESWSRILLEARAVEAIASQPVRLRAQRPESKSQEEP